MPEIIEQLVAELSALRTRVNALERIETPGIWADWTPTVTQSSSVTQFTANYARYVTVGRLVVVTAHLTMTTGASGSAGSSIVVGGLPISIANAAATTADLGSGVILDYGAAYYVGGAVWGSASTVAFRAHNTANAIGVSPSFGLAVSDTISFTICYER
jgi:hypothetical protein